MLYALKECDQSVLWGLAYPRVAEGGRNKVSCLFGLLVPHNSFKDTAVSKQGKMRLLFTSFHKELGFEEHKNHIN
jgi:hypothetical protein